MEQGIDLHPRARTQLSAGFSVGFFPLWDPGAVFSHRECCCSQCFLHKPGCGLRALCPHPCAEPSCYYFSLFMSCSSPRAFSELSPLSPAAPGNSGRQSARPLHEGFLFLIKLSGASPEGLVGVVKVKEKTLEPLFPGERGCVSSWNIWKGQGWDQGVQVPLDAGGAGSQSLSSSSQMVSNGTKENLKGNMGGKAKLIFLLCPEELGAFLGPHEDIWPPRRDQLMVQSHKGNFHIKPEANSLSRHLPGQLQLQEKPSNTSALGY